MANDISIDDRIQALPQELQDTILDYTLIPSAHTVTVDKSYIPPWQLAVNRRTRDVVAKSYYGEKHFIVSSKGQIQPPWPKHLLSSAHGWLASLSAQHQGLVSDIRAIFDGDSYYKIYYEDDTPLLHLEEATWEILIWLRGMEKLRTLFPNAIVSAQLRHKNANGSFEESSFRSEEEVSKFREVLVSL